MIKTVKTDNNTFKCSVCCNNDRTISCFEFERKHGLESCDNGSHHVKVGK